MRVLQYAGLLAGLMPSADALSVPSVTRGGMRATVRNVERADITANMGIWDIDSSCTNYPNGGTSGGEDKSSIIQAAFTEALLMGQAMLDSMDFARKVRPNQVTDKDDYLKWIRIAESLEAVLGFSPDPETEESSGDGYWADLYTLLEKMVDTLQSNQNDPSMGYNRELWGTSASKPMLLCDDHSWQWVGLEDIVPGTNEKFKDFDHFSEVVKQGAAGGWYKKKRWAFKLTAREMPIHCHPTAGGSTNLKDNSITLCNTGLTTWADMTTLTTWKNDDDLEAGSAIREGTQLRTIADTLSRAIFHELMHWFGGPSDKNDLSTWVIDDKQAVTDRGELIYKVGNQKRVSLTPQNWMPSVAYGVVNIWNLCLTFPGNQAQYGGPKVATKNADSLSYFAMMMYIDNWVWAYGGVARKPGQIYGHL